MNEKELAQSLYVQRCALIAVDPVVTPGLPAQIWEWAQTVAAFPFEPTVSIVEPAEAVAVNSAPGMEVVGWDDDDDEDDQDEG